eukprot:14721172-Ditylum_brightwellii.AAC.1
MVGNVKHPQCSWCADCKVDHGTNFHCNKCPNYDPNSCRNREQVAAAEEAHHLQQSEGPQGAWPPRNAANAALNINSNIPTGGIVDGVDLDCRASEDTVNAAEKDPPLLCQEA